MVQKHLQVLSSHSVWLSAGGPDPTLISITTKGLFLLECLVLNTRLNLFHSPVPRDRLSHGEKLISGQSLQHCMRSMQGLAVKCTEEGWRWDLFIHKVKSVAGNKAEICCLLLVRAITKFTTPVKAQGSLPCQRAQESCLILLRWQLLSHTDLSADITQRELWRGLSCNNTRSKSTLLKVSVYSIQLGQGRDSFSPFWNCCKT